MGLALLASAGWWLSLAWLHPLTPGPCPHLVSQAPFCLERGTDAAWGFVFPPLKGGEELEVCQGFVLGLRSDFSGFSGTRGLLWSGISDFEVFSGNCSVWMDLSSWRVTHTSSQLSSNEKGRSYAVYKSLPDLTQME